MQKCLALAMLFVLGTLCARAGDPWTIFDGGKWSFPKLHDERRDRAGWCPDDYCRKCMPMLTPNAKGCVDDYCRKSLPCVLPNAKGCVDDYCPKTCPIILGPLCGPGFVCVPAVSP